MTCPHIAVIDDGVNEKLYNIGKLIHNLEVKPDSSVSERVDYDPFMLSHGTTCAAIIKKYAPDSFLSSVKILSDVSHKGMKEQLICALKWCMDNGIRLINLSLGTVDYRDFDKIRGAVNNACEKGVIIVAACNNRNIFTCPASLQNVIGVKCDNSRILKGNEYIYSSLCPDGIEITAVGSHELLKYCAESRTTSPCNSFAAPVITAVVSGILRNNPDISINEIKEILKQGALNVSPNYNCSLQESKLLNNYKNVLASIDIPIIIVYNYLEKRLESGKNVELTKLLTRKFRSEGYDAVSVFTGKGKSDLCSGQLYTRDFSSNTVLSVIESIVNISKIFDPDIIVLSAEIQKADNNKVLRNIKSLDVDIEIYVNGVHGIEVTSSYGTRTFGKADICRTEQLYTYITDLFANDEVEK